MSFNKNIENFSKYYLYKTKNIKDLENALNDPSIFAKLYISTNPICPNYILIELFKKEKITLIQFGILSNPNLDFKSLKIIHSYCLNEEIKKTLYLNPNWILNDFA